MGLIWILGHLVVRVLLFVFRAADATQADLAGILVTVELLEIGQLWLIGLLLPLKLLHKTPFMPAE